MDAAKETATPTVSSSVAAASPDATMVLDCKQEKTCEQNELGSHIKQERMEELKKSIEISEQRHELLEILIRKDSTIDNLSFELQNLEIRLKSAVTGKLDALARLEKIEGKEQALLFKEKQMNLDMENRNRTIESLTNELNKNVTELTASRQELISASAQFEIDIKELSEQLKMANLSIGELSRTNGTLKQENYDYMLKLQEQLNESTKVMEAYKNDLKAKTELAQSYKELSGDYEVQVDDLHGGVIELQRLLSETVDDCGKLETRLMQVQLDGQAESDAKDEMITKMQQELKDANFLLQAYGSHDVDNNDVHEEVNDLSCLVDHRPLTYTEVYSQWRSAAKELQKKEQECKTLQTEIATLIEEIKKKAVDFEKQQNELEQHKAANHQLQEDRNCFLVERVVSREELENSRLHCDLLKNENEKLKFFGNEYLTKLLSNSNDQPSDHLNTAVASVVGTKSNTIEVEQQNEKLVAVINNLMAKLQGTETSGILLNDSTATATVISSTTTDVCHKSVGVTENDLMIAVYQRRSDIENAKSQSDNLLLLDELKQDNHKLQNTIRELTAERNLLLAEQRLFDARYNFCKEQIKSLHTKNLKYENIVEENSFTLKYLRDDNANISMQLSTTEDQLTCLEKQHISLRHVKSSLVVEVEALKQELVKEKVSNKTHRYEIEMMKKAVDQLKIELQMRTSDNSDCRVLVNRLERSVKDFSHNVSILYTNESVQTDLENVSHGYHADISSEAMDDYSPVTGDTTLSLLQPVPSSEVTSRKRKSQNTAEAASSSSTFCATRLRPKKQPRVSFVNLSDDSDKEESDINVCDTDSGPDLPNVEKQYLSEELQCLSEVRTRNQAKFILDAFNIKNPKCIPDEKAVQTTSKANTRRSSRSRSSGRRSRSADCHQSTVGQQQANGGPEMASVTLNDGKVTNPKPKRRRCSKRSQSYSNGRASNRVSSRSRSSFASLQQPIHQKSDVDRQHPIDYDCYIVPQAEITKNSRRSHRLMSRYRRQAEGSLK